MARTAINLPKRRDRIIDVKDVDSAYDNAVLMELRRAKDSVVCSSNGWFRDFVSVPRDAYDSFSGLGYPTVGELKRYSSTGK